MTRSRQPRAYVAFSLAFAAVFTVGTALAGGGLRDLIRGSEVIEHEADARLDALDIEVEELRNAVRALPRSQRRVARRGLVRMERIIHDLRDDTDALARMVVDAAEEARPRRGETRRGGDRRGQLGGVVYVEPSRTVCTKTDFTNVLDSVENASFDSGKMQVLQDAAGSRWFTVAQVKTLVGRFAFSSYQVDAAALLHARTLDLENWFQVYDALTFSSSKSELRRRVGA
jgi:hypothetical protein